MNLEQTNKYKFAHIMFSSTSHTSLQLFYLFYVFILRFSFYKKLASVFNLSLPGLMGQGSVSRTNRQN